MAGISLYKWHLVLADSGKDNLFIYDPEIVEPLHKKYMRIDVVVKARADARQMHREFFREGRAYRTAVIGVCEDLDMKELLRIYETRFGERATRLKDAGVAAVFSTDHEKAELLLEDIIDNPKRYTEFFLEEKAHQ
jgi:hypothetical protein